MINYIKKQSIEPLNVSVIDNVTESYEQGGVIADMYDPTVALDRSCENCGRLYVRGDDGVIARTLTWAGFGSYHRFTTVCRPCYAIITGDFRGV